MWSQFRYCLRSARLENGVDLTLRFSFKRDGSLNGEPKVSYFNLRGDTEAERRNAEAVSQALDHCLPVSISDALGGTRSRDVRCGSASTARGGKGRPEDRLGSDHFC